MSRRQRQTTENAHKQHNIKSSVNRTRQRKTADIIEISEFKRPKKQVMLLPKNLAQERYIDCLSNPNVDIVIASGSAGTGKTYIGSLYAIKCLREGIVDKVVITRPNVDLDDTGIGHLPGDIFQKMSPWTRPILDVFEEYYSVKEITAMLEENILEICPLSFIRGRTFKNSIIILDEAQNTTQKSLLGALTRIGNGSRLIITGDTKQTDRGSSNGLSDFLNRFKNSDRIKVCEFGTGDIERHPVIAEILKIYGEE